MKLVVHPLAREEIDEAIDRYCAISPRLARRFRDQLDAVLSDIAANPLRWGFYEPLASHQRWRRCKTGGFPYIIVYEETTQGVRVIAMPHASQRPGYWKDR